MSTFKLPDLGEGLPDAEIHEWFVNVGDHVETDQPLVAMETAKAVVEVPSPFTGKVKQLHGKAGDIIQVGSPLIEFESEAKQDSGTVVGSIETSDEVITESAIGVEVSKQAQGIKATPAVRAMAKKLNIDLATISGSGPNGSITIDDLHPSNPPAASGETLHSTRRAMAIAMAKAHAEIVPVTICDEADIQHWPEDTDITLRLLTAMTKACQAEKILNSHFDGKTLSQKIHEQINVGIAVDTKDGLFVPVIHDIANQSATELRNNINRFKQKAKTNSFTPDDLKGATITLSNFGTIAGRYASPIVVPPQVAIVGIGKVFAGAVKINGQLEAHDMLPVSVTFDHRAATGGEAARFLAAFLAELSR